MTTTLAVAVDIAAPASLTWQVVTDWERQGEWMPLTTVRVEPGPSMGMGAKLNARSGLGPAGFDDPMVIDVWEPPYRCEVVHLGKVVTGRGIFEVSDVGAGHSRFSWQEVLDSGGARRLLDRAAALPTRAMLTVALRRLARVVEADARHGAGPHDQGGAS